MDLLRTLIVPAMLLLAGHAGAAGAQDAPVPAADDRGAQVSVAPLRLEMAGAETAAVLRVTNPSGREIGVQVRTFGWAQQNGEDAYFATDDVMISPSIIQIAPGQTQIFRVVRRDAASAGEKRLRIAVDQLPDPGLEKAGEAQARIRFTLPLFLDRDQAAAPALAWTIDADGIHLFNGGGQTVRLVSLTATQAGGAPVEIERNTLRYVHGGSTIHWPISACPAGTITLTASIDGTPHSAQVPSSCS